MVLQLNTSWQQTIEAVKNEFPQVHLFYSSTEGWMKVSYKDKKKLITDKLNIAIVSDLISWMIRHGESKYSAPLNTG